MVARSPFADPAPKVLPGFCCAQHEILKASSFRHGCPSKIRKWTSQMFQYGLFERAAFRLCCV